MGEIKRQTEKKINSIKRTWQKVITLIKNPGHGLADFLYQKVYKFEKDKIPYPIFLFILKYYGGWAGVGIYMSMREFDYKKKIKKFKDISKVVIVVTIITTGIIVGATQSSDSFMFGVVQELLAEIVSIVIIFYGLPRLLNPPKKFDLTIFQKSPFGQSYRGDSKPIINIVLRNDGLEFLDVNEGRWELFIQKDILEESDFISSIGKREVISEVFGEMWKISGDINAPLFSKQEIVLLSFQVNREYLIGELLSLNGAFFKVYYLLRTINGNIPTIDKVTRDFMGIGISNEIYPQYGEITFDEWIDVYQYDQKKAASNEM